LSACHCGGITHEKNIADQSVLFSDAIVLLTGFNASAAAASVCIECHGGLSGQLGEIPTAEWHTSIHAPIGFPATIATVATLPIMSRP
jgi:hypothetical protein